MSSQDPTTTDTAGETPVPDPGADAQPPGGTGGGDASAPPPPPAPVGGAPSLDAKIESRASVDIAAPALSVSGSQKPDDSALKSFVSARNLSCECAVIGCSSVQRAR